MSDGTHVPDRNSGLVVGPFDLDIRNLIRPVFQSLDRGAVNAVLHGVASHQCNRRAGRSSEKRDRLARSVETGRGRHRAAGRRTVPGCRPRVSRRPGPARRPPSTHRTDDEILREAPPEAAAEKHGVDLDLLRIETATSCPAPSARRRAPASIPRSRPNRAPPTPCSSSAPWRRARDTGRRRRRRRCREPARPPRRRPSGDDRRVVDEIRTRLLIVAVDSPALPPSSHLTSSASRAVFAVQKPSATTATPLPSCTTWRTPVMALARVPSNEATFPPMTGERATTATSMPGNVRRSRIAQCH